MNDVVSMVERALSAPHDYWEEARRGLPAAESLEGLLPPSRALPECPEAAALVAEGTAAWRGLLKVVREEPKDTRAFSISTTSSSIGS
jgi:hypothetical protein